MGLSEDEDALWARIMNAALAPDDPELAPEGIDGVLEKDFPEMFERCRALIAERRENPTDDLMSILSTPRLTARNSRRSRS